MCRLCNKIYEHSNNQRTENSTSKQHVEDRNCIRRQRTHADMYMSEDVRNYVRTVNSIRENLRRYRLQKVLQKDCNNTNNIHV